MPILRRRSTLLPALLALTWTGAPCAADEVPKDKAELRLHAAMSGTNASSFFDGYSTEACEDGKGPGRLATFNFFAKKEQSELVPVGAPLYVLGVLHVTPKSGEHMLKNACRSMRSFVPEAGRVYEIRQDSADRNCPVTIKDAKTGAEVKTQKMKPKGACRDKK
ncbi:MAG: hypothetical protein ACRES8_00795 [Nevskiaceae bacterium]